jgi:hypothetical protein
MKRMFWICLAGLIIAGMVVTFWDYRNWQRAELAHYGQGWSDLKAPALKLSKMYQNDLIKVRLRLPEEWKATGGQEIIIQGMMRVRITNSNKNLTDLVAEKVKRITDGGDRLSRDWEYVNSDKIDMTIITWQTNLPGDGSGEKIEVRQAAMAKKGDRLLEIDTTVPFDNWGNYENTILEIYKSTELL